MPNRTEDKNVNGNGLHALPNAGRSLTRADLALLRDMQHDLEAQVAAEADSSLFSDTYVAIFDGR